MMKKKYLIHMSTYDAHECLFDRLVMAECQKDMEWEVANYYSRHYRDEKIAECKVYELNTEVDISSFVEATIFQLKKERKEKQIREQLLLEESDKEQKEIYKPTLVPLFEGGTFTVLNITDDNSKLCKLLKIESEFFEEFEVSLYTQRFIYSHNKNLDVHFWVEEENSKKIKQMETFISGFIRGLEVK